MELKSSPKIFNNYKSDTPENTIKRIEDPFRKLGLNLDYNEIEVSSDHFSTYSGFLVIRELGFMTVGKGISPILSKASAFAEMAERFSSAHFTFYSITFNLEKYFKIVQDVLEKKFLKGYTKKGKLIPEDFTKINNYIEEGIDKDNFKHFKDQKLFDSWVDCYSFANKNYSKLPIKFIETISGSSGLASGNTNEEAIVQATCENFERYAVYKILSNGIICPTIQVDTIQDPRIHNLVDMFNSMNITVVIKDFTLGNKIPVVGVLFINNNFENDKNELKKDFYYKMLNAGSHNDINEAIIRCFTERLQEITKQDFMFRKKYDIIYDFWTNKLKNNYRRNPDAYFDYFSDYEFEEDLSFLEKGEQISLEKLDSYNHTDCLDDFKVLLEICNKNNWDFQVIDYTHNVINFPTFRVVIPPISTTHHPYVLTVLKKKNFIERFNYFYGIKDFYKYSMSSNKWIQNKKEILRLIGNIEEYLSNNLSFYSFPMRNGCFYYLTNLFHVLAFLYLSVERYNNALECFKILLQLNENPPYLSNYFNAQLNPGYNPILFSSYINAIEKGMQDGTLPKFTLNSNPFLPKSEVKEFEQIFNDLLTNISNSFLS